MFTLFTIPKPFAGHIGVIQRNAIQSWKCLSPGCEIILVGSEPGVAETAKEFALNHFPTTARTPLGTPLLNDAFGQAAARARFPLLCYVNADIILMSDFIRPIESICLRDFLVVGQRWDLDVREPLDFSKDWEKRLRDQIRQHGVLHARTGSDYFLFPRASEVGKLPPFAVGRAGWDNWMIFNARRRRSAVVDVSDTVRVVHQNHAYGHVPEARDAAWDGPESDRNLTLARDMTTAYTLDDASHALSEGQLRRSMSVRQLWPSVYRWRPKMSLAVRKCLAGWKA